MQQLNKRYFARSAIVANQLGFKVITNYGSGISGETHYAFSKIRKTAASSMNTAKGSPKSNQELVEFDEINPGKREMLQKDAEAYEKAEKEGRLVDVPLTEEQKRSIQINGDD